MKYFLILKLMLVSKIAMSQIMLPAYQGVVAKIPAIVTPAFACGTSTITDVDGNVYNTVSIGTQCWMASNLRVTKYNDGTLIPLDNSGGSTGDGSTETWTARTSGALTVYAHSNGNLITYGYLYNWYAATDFREICPTGWHVPSDAEWTTLTTFLGGLSVAGGKMKSTGTTYWTSPNTSADNSSGFAALPGGVRFHGANGLFDYIKRFARFGSTTMYSSTVAYFRQLDFDDINVTQGTCGKACGQSVRCLRD
ncbi:MAG: fibrobacter succinogenes major paralogous domain-containing protein [Bacteroidota bacterium]